MDTVDRQLAAKLVRAHAQPHPDIPKMKAIHVRLLNGPGRDWEVNGAVAVLLNARRSWWVVTGDAHDLAVQPNARTVWYYAVPRPGRAD